MSSEEVMMGGVGDNISSKNGVWSFDGEELVKSFEDHVSRSVPMYNNGHDLILRIGDYFIKKESVVVDVGSSTGALCNKIYQRNIGKNIKIIGVDVSLDMTKYANEHYANKNCVFVNEDATVFDFGNPDIVVAYYTIQFIQPAYRQQLIDKIYASLNWGGAFFMFEKTRGADARFQDIITGVYFDYKLEEGYTKEEVMSKFLSLKGILEPFSTQGNIDMLKRAGFEDINTIFKFVPFEGFLAIK
jgi:tRNA (cmo5U34)-methyltransferase